MRSDRNSAPRNCPWLAIAPYIRASARAVATPLAAGISESRNGVSPCTSDITPGKYIEPNAPEKGRAAILGATKSKIWFGQRRCGPRISAARVGAPAGGRPR